MPVLKARVNGVWVPLGSASEVEVTPTDPIGTNPQAELWFDTDEPASMPDDMRWYTAWGVVAMGSFVQSPQITTPNNAYTTLTNTLTFAPLAGRRYQVGVGLRAVESTTSTAGFAQVALRDGATQLASAAIMTYPASGVWNNFDFGWPIVGDGVSRAFNVVFFNNGGSPALVWIDSPSYFWIEDVGPVTGAAMVPPATGLLPIGMRVYGPFETTTSAAMAPGTGSQSSIVYNHNLALTTAQQATSMVSAMPMDGSWAHGVGWRAIVTANTVTFYIVNLFSAGEPSVSVKFRFMLFVGA